MPFRNLTYWFNRRQTGKAVIILKSGDVVNIDYSKPGDRARANATFNDYFGYVAEIPATKTWQGEAPNPAHPEWTVRVSDHSSAGDAIMALLKKVREEEAAEKAILSDPKVSLERELKHHDWFAAYSDSPGVSGAADRHWDLIQELRKKVEPPVYDELFAKYAPKEMVK